MEDDWDESSWGPRPPPPQPLRSWDTPVIPLKMQRWLDEPVALPGEAVKRSPPVHPAAATPMRQGLRFIDLPSELHAQIFKLLLPRSIDCAKRGTKDCSVMFVNKLLYARGRDELFASTMFKVASPNILTAMLEKQLGKRWLLRLRNLHLCFTWEDYLSFFGVGFKCWPKRASGYAFLLDAMRLEHIVVPAERLEIHGWVKDSLKQMLETFHHDNYYADGKGHEEVRAQSLARARYLFPHLADTSEVKDRLPQASWPATPEPVMEPPLECTGHAPFGCAYGFTKSDPEEILNDSAVLDDMDGENWYLVTTPVLASMTVPVVRVIVEGSLPKDFQKPGPIRDALKATAENSRNRPDIHALVLADKNKESPTARELLDSIKTVRTYCGTGPEANKLAAKVDTQMDNRRNSRVKALPPGHHRYLAKKSDGRVSSAKRDMILEFCTELEDRLRGLSNLDDPIEHPLFYFGWSANLQQRINQHTNHQSSNETMDLFHAILMLLFKQRGFRIWAFPLCFLTKPARSAIAEVLFTVLGNGYRPNGFNSRPTGLNNDSANTIHAHVWALDAAYIQRATPFVLNMQNEEHYIELSTQVINETVWTDLERAAQPVEVDYSECDAAIDRLNATLDRLDEIEGRLDELSDFSQLSEIPAEYADMSAWELPPTNRRIFYRDQNPKRQRNLYTIRTGWAQCGEALLLQFM